MKVLLLFKMLLFMVTHVFILLAAKNLRTHSKAKSKKAKKDYITYPIHPVGTGNQVLGSYMAIDPRNLYTPLTTGVYSSGGQLYTTNAGYIPYGTGYSYGPWKKIPDSAFSK